MADSAPGSQQSTSQFNQPFKPAWSPQLPPGLSIGQNGLISSIPVSFMMGLTLDKLTLTGAAPQISLNNATSDWIAWTTAGQQIPTFTTRSIGTKLLLYPALSGSSADFAIGMNSASTIWQSVPNYTTLNYFAWYGGTTNIAYLDGTGQLTLFGSNHNLAAAGNNTIIWNSAGVNSPTFTTRSVGTKLVLYPSLSGSQVDFAIGVGGGQLWQSVPQSITSNYFEWYGGTTIAAYLDGTGQLTLLGSNHNLEATGNNTIIWNGYGVAPPSFTTRSLGSKLVLFPAVSPTAADYAIGISDSTLWQSVQNATSTLQFAWYGGTTKIGYLTGDGSNLVLGVSNQCQFGFNSVGGTVAGVAPTLLGLAVPSAGWKFSFDTGGNFGVTGGLSVSSGIRVGAGAISKALLDGYVRLQPGGTDELAAIELQGGALSGGTTNAWSLITGNPTGSYNANLSVYNANGGIIASFGSTVNSYRFTHSYQASIGNNSQGIGTSGSLYVDGDITSSRNGSTGAVYYGNSSSTYTYYDGTNWTIGTNATTNNFTVNSTNAYKTTAGSWLAVSDVKFKKNIVDYPYGMAEVRQMTPRRFQFNGTSPLHPDDGTVYSGMIAQEIGAIIPTTVHTPPQQLGANGEVIFDGTTLAFDPSELLYACINALKEIDSRLSSVEARLAAAKI